jgi:4-hydroxybenzoyl-CoA reductase subunit beta
MLRLPQFGVVTPTTVDEVVAALAPEGARIVAGGTDILPNLKHRLDQPPVLVSLGRVEELRRASLEDGHLVLGAGLTLTEVAEHPDVREHFPSLADAAGRVASPLIRNMGTLGGNVNLDTRCRYVNQTEFWRGAIGGGCIKSEGDVCHVVPKGRNCVAAMSSDCVPVLISLEGVVELAGPEGRRSVPIAEYFRADGTAHTACAPNELTTAIRVPLPSGPRRTHYVKWTVRQSIDFPLVSVALRFDLDADDPGAAIRAVHVVTGVLGAKPRVVRKLDECIGKALNDPDVARIVSETAYKQCKPLPNVPYESEYRRTMIRVHTRRAIERLSTDD